MKSGGVLILASLFAAAPAQASAPVWPTGLYSNVRLHEETGDLGGMEARFYEEGGRHMVEFVWCEGWCNETFKVPVTPVEGGVTFTYFQRFSDGGAEDGIAMRFLAWREGKRLRISAWQGEEPLDYEGKPQTLRPAKRTFGIGVANSGKE